MVLRMLQWAIKEKIKEVGRGYRLEEDRSAFGEVVSNLYNSIESWQTSAYTLYDFNNWKHHLLIEENGKFRKPKILLGTRINQSNNLNLDWYPASKFEPMAASDFWSWSDEWYAAREPVSRIVTIRKFGDLNGYPARLGESILESEKNLVEAVAYHLESIHGVLRATFDVVLETHLFRRYEEGPKPYIDRRMIGYEIRDVKEFQKETEEKKRGEWLSETFGKRFNVTPVEFLKLFEDSGNSYPGTSRELKKKDIKISPDQVRRLIHRLATEFSSLYMECCSKIPPGLEKTKGLVVPIRPKGKES